MNGKFIGVAVAILMFAVVDKVIKVVALLSKKTGLISLVPT